MGCMMPCALMLSASSYNAPSSMRVRGWYCPATISASRNSEGEPSARAASVVLVLGPSRASSPRPRPFFLVAMVIRILFVCCQTVQKNGRFALRHACCCVALACSWPETWSVSDAPSASQTASTHRNQWAENKGCRKTRMGGSLAQPHGRNPDAHHLDRNLLCARCGDAGFNRKTPYLRLRREG